MVYVDDFNAPFGNMVMCHMIADSTFELLEMADKIGVKRKWIQYPNTPGEHFDICQTMKNKAIKLGALEVSSRVLCKSIVNRKDCNSPLNIKIDKQCQQSLFS